MTARIRYKVPISVLVLVYTRDLDVLLLERADFPDHWQSVKQLRDLHIRVRASDSAKVA